MRTVKLLQCRDCSGLPGSGLARGAADAQDKVAQDNAGTVLAYGAQASRVVPRTREMRLRRLMLGVRRVCCSSSFVIGDVLCRDSLCTARQ